MYKRQEHLEVAGERLLELLAGKAHQVASGNGFLCHCLGLKDALLYNEFGGLLGMLVDVLHACRLTLEKFLDCLGVLVKKLSAHDGDAGDELAGCLLYTSRCV